MTKVVSAMGRIGAGNLQKLSEEYRESCGEGFLNRPKIC